MHKLLEVNCNQTKSTPKNLFQMSDFWIYSVSLGVLIRQGGKASLMLTKNHAYVLVNHVVPDLEPVCSQSVCETTSNSYFGFQAL